MSIEADPQYERLLISLNNSGYQQKNNALYQTVKGLISAVQRFQNLLKNDIAPVVNTVATNQLVIQIVNLQPFYSAELWALCIDPTGLAGKLVFSLDPTFENDIQVGNLVNVAEVSNLHAIGSLISGAKSVTTTGAPEFSLYTAGTAGPNLRSGFSFIRSRGTVSAPDAVDSGDRIGFFGFKGYDGTSAVLTALIEARVDGAVSAGVVPQQLEFITGTTGAGRTTKLLIGSNGLIVIGSAAAQTNAFPALKRSFAELHTRLADDSNYAIFRARGFRAHSDNSAVWIGQRFSNSAADGANFESQRARGTQAAPSAIQLNDVLNGFFAAGATGVASFSSNVVAIRAVAAENFSPGNAGAFWEFYTTPIGADARVLHWLITSDGHWQAGQGNELIRWGGTSAFPALKRNTTSIHVRLADDSAFAPVKSLNRAEDVFTTTSTGSQNNFDFGNAGVLRCNNASDLTLTGLVAGVDGQELTIVSIGAGNVFLSHQSGSSTDVNRLINFATSAPTPLAAGKGTALYRYDGTTQRWRLISHEQGEYIDVPFDAGDYTGNAGMTWTLDAGDVDEFRWLLSGVNLFVRFRVRTTSCSGGQNTLIIDLIPGGFTLASAGIPIIYWYRDAGGGGTAGIAFNDGSTTHIGLGKLDGATWGAATNNTQISLSAGVEVQ